MLSEKNATVNIVEEVIAENDFSSSSNLHNNTNNYINNNNNNQSTNSANTSSSSNIKDLQDKLDTSSLKDQTNQQTLIEPMEIVIYFEFCCEEFF